MQVAVLDAGPESILLRAPLAPNINHRETVFGGSAAAVATLAAWSLAHVRLKRAGIESRLVIQRNTIEYTLPIAGDFTARSFIPAPDAWESFVRTLARRGRARITVASVLEYQGQVAASFEGDFVSLGHRRG